MFKRTVYHGTRVAHLDVLRPSLTGAQGPGIYLADRPESAALYGSVVLAVDVQLNQPFFFYPSDDSLDAEINPELIQQVLGEAEAQKVFQRLEQDGALGYGTEVAETLKARGHDGIVMVYPFGTPVIPGVAGEAVIIAFSPDQTVVLGPVPAPV